MKRIISTLTVMSLLSATLLVVAPVLQGNNGAVYAQVTDAICDPNNDGDKSDAIDKVACNVSDKDSAQSAIGKIISRVVQTLVFIVGGISVIVIVIGGLMYVLSAGESNNTRRAKDAILFAVIGLVIALVAQGLVTFVLSRI